MSIDDRHAAHDHDQDPEDLPTMTLAEPRAAARHPQQARADVAMTPADPPSTYREPALTGGEGSAVESELGAPDDARHGQATAAWVSPGRVMRTRRRHPPTSRRSRVPTHRLTGWTLPGLRPKDPRIPRFSPTTNSPGYARGGTACRPVSSTIPGTACTRLTAWYPTSSASSPPGSPRRGRAWNTSGAAAKKHPPRTCASHSPATETSSSDCSRCDTHRRPREAGKARERIDTGAPARDATMPVAAWLAALAGDNASRLGSPAADARAVLEPVAAAPSPCGYSVTRASSSRRSGCRRAPRLLHNTPPSARAAWLGRLPRWQLVAGWRCYGRSASRTAETFHSRW